MSSYELYHNASIDASVSLNGRSNGHSPSTDIDESLLTFSADDAGNGEAMHYLYGSTYLYTSVYGWMHWNGTHWECTSDAPISRAAMDTLRKRRATAARLSDGNNASYEDIIKSAKPNTSRINSCIQIFRSLVTVENISVFDAETHLLNCLNGVVDLRTSTLTSHNPTQRFTYCVPVAYNPLADSSIWENFIHEALGYDTDAVAYMQKCMGYSLTGDTREEKLFYAYGPLRAGKGTFSEVMLALLPSPIGMGVDFNTFTAKRDADNQNFDLAPMKPSRFVVASESNRYQSLNPAKIKQMTGGDMVRAAFKHRDMFEYRPQFKVWLLSNNPVNGDPDDDALWHRVQVFSFPISHQGREDTGLKNRLKSQESLEGILRWAIDGAKKWYTNGLSNVPQSVTDETRRHREEQDYVAHWISDCIQSASDNTWVKTSDIMTSYVAWCKNGSCEKPLSKNQLSKTLVERFKWEKYRQSNNGTRGFRGVSIIGSSQLPEVIEETTADTPTVPTQETVTTQETTQDYANIPVRTTPTCPLCHTKNKVRFTCGTFKCDTCNYFIPESEV